MIKPVVVSLNSESDASIKLLKGQLHAIGDKNRLKMLAALGGGRELCACDLKEITGISQPLTSHHLRVLREAGLVEYRRKGTWLHYRQNSQAVSNFMAKLREILGGFPEIIQARECAPA